MGAAARKEVISKRFLTWLRKFNKQVFVAIVILLSLQALFYVFTNLDQFFSRDYERHFQEYKKDYYSSQYIVKNNPKIIPDETLEAFAGGVFLKGLNPILITHDHPPLGRYLTALSILIFDNSNTIILFTLSLSAIGIFLITYSLCKNLFVSLIPMGIFINEPLFLNKLVYTPLLEPIQLPFIIFALYFFILANKKRNYILWFVSTSIMLGFVISTRFFVVGGVMLFIMLIYLFLKHKLGKPMLIFISTLPLSLAVLFLSYTKTILDGYSLIQILGVQEYILHYHNSKFILPLTFWDLLLFNRWHTWWENNAIIRDPHWTLLWPISTALFFISLVVRIIGKLSLPKELDILFLWVLFYMLMLSVGYTTTRYFLPLLPFLYIIITVTAYKLFIFHDRRALSVR